MENSDVTELKTEIINRLSKLVYFFEIKGIDPDLYIPPYTKDDSVLDLWHYLKYSKRQVKIFKKEMRHRQALNKYLYSTPNENPTMRILAGAFSGMAEAILDPITSVTYTETTETLNCKICSIVLLTGDKCRNLTCKHYFHRECIVRYVDRVKPECPICKTKIESSLGSVIDILSIADEIKK